MPRSTFVNSSQPSCRQTYTHGCRYINYKRIYKITIYRSRDINDFRILYMLVIKHVVVNNTDIVFRVYINTKPMTVTSEPFSSVHIICLLVRYD